MQRKHPWPRLRSLAQRRVESVCSTLGKMEWSASADAVLDGLCGEWPEWEAAYDPEWPSDITDDGSPFELSIELGGAEPLVRMLIEPQTRPREGESWAMSSWRAGLAATARLRALGADVSRYEAIRDLYAPLPSIGVRFSVWYACTLGSGQPRDFKVYLNPQVVGSEAAPLLVARTMSELGLERPFAHLRTVMSESARPSYISLDLTEPGASRVKVYYAHPGETTAQIAKQLADAGAPALDLHRLMDELADGPTDSLSRPIQTCFAFRAGDTVPEVNVYVPLRAVVIHDAEAIERLTPLLAPARLALVRAAASTMTTRTLEEGRGVITYAGLRLAGGRRRVVVYLSPQVYASQSARTTETVAPLPVRRSSRPPSKTESGVQALRTNGGALPTNIGELRALVEKERAHLAKHAFFATLRQHASMPDVQRIAPRVAFFVMAFQDVLRLVTEKTTDPHLRQLARAHQLEDAGHDHWYLRDLEVLGISTSLSMLFGRDARAIRDVSYHQIADAIRSESDLARFAVVLCLEAAGVEFFGSMVDGLDRLGRSEGLLYFSKTHQAVEASHEIFEDAKQDAIDAIAIPASAAAEVVRAVMRTFDTMRSLADDLGRVLDRAEPEARSA